MDGVQYSQEGLLLLIRCLNQLIDTSGKRNDLLNTSKDKVLEIYKAAQDLLPVDVVNEQLKISSQKVYRMRIAGRCSSSITKNCIKLCPTQLSVSEQAKIIKYLNDPELGHLPTNHIWAAAQRDGLFVSKATFYRYVREIRGPRPRKKKEEVTEENKPKTVQAMGNYEILHMDSTIVKCENGERVYVHFVMDNFSRKVLGAVASYSSKSDVVAKNLRKVISEYNLENVPFELYRDDGPENHGDVSELLKDEKVKITKVVANYINNKSNNMIEAWNKKFKRDVLHKFRAKSFAHLVNALPKMVAYFNNLNLPVLGTLTPNEVNEGKKYEDLEVANKMYEAKLLRLVQNKKLDCELKAEILQLNYHCLSTPMYVY